MSEECFVQSSRCNDFRRCGRTALEELQELIPGSSEEVPDDAGNSRIAHVGEVYPRLVVVGLCLELPIQESLQIEPVQDGHDRRVSQRPLLSDGNLYVFDRNGIATP